MSVIKKFGFFTHVLDSYNLIYVEKSNAFAMNFNFPVKGKILIFKVFFKVKSI